jgi:hypothetical protein
MPNQHELMRLQESRPPKRIPFLFKWCCAFTKSTYAARSSSSKALIPGEFYPRWIH